MKNNMGKAMRTFKFTVKEIEALPPHDPDSPSSELELSDAECRGLKLCISKTGRKSFTHRYRITKGKKSVRRCIKIGEFPYVSLKNARQIVMEHKIQLNKGVDPSDERQKSSNELTFNEFFETKYIPDHAMPNKKSWQDDQRMYDFEIKDDFSGYLLSEIKKHVVVNLINKVAARASKPRANRYLSLISKVMSTAIDWDYLDGINPCKGIKKFPENPNRTRYLSPDEIIRLKNALESAGNQVSACAVWFLLSTGCRLGEAMKMTWDMVDLDNKIAYLPSENTKNKKMRPVFLNKQALETLNKLAKLKKPNNPYIFPGSNNGCHLTTPRKTFDTAKRIAEIKDCRIHDLRHTFASIAIQSGTTSIYTIKELLGHSSIEMTMRYAHLNPKTLTNASNSVGSQLSDILD